MAYPIEPVTDPDLEYHYDTYHGFLRWTVIFVAHVALVLVLLAYFFG
jgi:hypothetical protein